MTEPPDMVVSDEAKASVLGVDASAESLPVEAEPRTAGTMLALEVQNDLAQGESLQSRVLAACITVANTMFATADNSDVKIQAARDQLISTLVRTPDMLIQTLTFEVVARPGLADRDITDQIIISTLTNPATFDMLAQQVFPPTTP